MKLFYLSRGVIQLFLVCNITVTCEVKHHYATKQTELLRRRRRSPGYKVIEFPAPFYAFQSMAGSVSDSEGSVKVK